MKLFIAEKPSVAQAIADVLGGGKKAAGFIDLPAVNAKVTWCYGHLLEQEQPEYYVEGGKVLTQHLPVIPQEFKLSPRAKAADQVKVIKKLLKEADEVINAGDADREGQLLVDELFPVLGWKGKTQRLWLSSLDEESVKLALLKLKNNDEYQKLYQSALGRSRADWLVSLNCSIALSRNLQAMAVPGAWSIGRVQTPTLALVVDRADAITSFSKQEHYSVVASLLAGEDTVKANWLIPEDLTIDGMLLDKTKADLTSSICVGQNFIVKRFEIKPGTKAAPMPFTLGALQTAASKSLGFSATETLAAAQALYEAKVTTYPRTDCAYLPVEMWAKAPEILMMLGFAGSNIDPKLKHAAWNTTKVEAHHGIVPTGVNPDGKALDPKAAKLFELISKSFAQLFMLPESFELRHATLEDKHSNVFEARSRTVIEPGWTKGLVDDEEDKASEEEGLTQLPNLAIGQQLQCVGASVLTKQTAPPKHYTDGTLIAAMKSVHKLVSDPQLKARLKETSGLGTEATRAGMIETLITRGYLVRKGKELAPTTRGRQLVEWLRSNTGTAVLTDPGATALQEDLLADIASGRLAFDDFMSQVVESAKFLCGQLLDSQFVKESDLILKSCPACQGQRCTQMTSQAGRLYFLCLGCQSRFANENGSPGKRFEAASTAQRSGARSTASNKGNGPNCPSCKEPTVGLKTKNEKPYFRCFSCGVAWWSQKDKPKTLGSTWPQRDSSSGASS